MPVIQITRNTSVQEGSEHAVMPDYSGTGQHQHDPDAQAPLTAVGGISDPGYKLVGQLEKEDTVILVLSAILVVATFWLAARIL